jgi:hypothetical protein
MFGIPSDKRNGSGNRSVTENAVYEILTIKKTSDRVRPLVHRNGVSSAVELFGTGQSRRTGSDDGNLLPRPCLGGLGLNPSLLIGAVDDCTFDALDLYRSSVDSIHTSRLTRGRTNSPGCPGHVVRGLETQISGVPVIPEDELVPRGNQIADRAPAVRLTERNTAVWKQGNASAISLASVVACFISERKRT